MEPVTKNRKNVLMDVLLCVLLFLLSCLFICLLVFRAGNTARIIKDVDITEMFHETDLGYYILNQLNGLPFNTAEIFFYQVEMLVLSEAVTDEIGDVVVRYSRALAVGDLDYHLTENDVIEILQKLEPELSNLFGHQMTQADYERFADTLDDILDFRSLTVAGVFADIEYLGFDTTIPRLVLSSYLLWAVGILFFATLFIIFMRCRKELSRAFLIAGIPIMLSGLMYFTVGTIFGHYQQLLSESLKRFTRFTDGIAYLFFWHGIAFIAVGLICIVVYFILDYSTTRHTDAEGQPK